MSAKGLYINKPLQLADRLEGMGFYLDEEGAAVIRKQHAEIKALRAEVEALRAERDALREALDWIARVNAMDYEYQAKARAAIDAARNKT